MVEESVKEGKFNEVVWKKLGSKETQEEFAYRRGWRTQELSESRTYKIFMTVGVTIPPP